MVEREFERMLERLLGQDFSIGTEAFRDALLARCLDELDADDETVVIGDDDLVLIAAAGGPMLPERPRGSRGGVSDSITEL